MNPLAAFNSASVTIRVAIVAGLVLVVLAAVAFFEWRASTTDAATIKLQGAQQTATTKSATDAISTIDNTTAAAAATDDVTRSNANAIDSATGAQEKVAPAVQAAGIAALCRRAAYASDPKCKPPHAP